MQLCPSGNWTRDLQIASPMPHCYVTSSSCVIVEEGQYQYSCDYITLLLCTLRLSGLFSCWPHGLELSPGFNLGPDLLAYVLTLLMLYVMLLFFFVFTITLWHCAIENNCSFCILCLNLYYPRLFFSLFSNSWHFQKMQFKEQLQQFWLTLMQIWEWYNEGRSEMCIFMDYSIVGYI